MTQTRTRARRVLEALVDHNPRCATPTPIWRTPLARILYSVTIAYNTSNEGTQLVPIPDLRPTGPLLFLLNLLFVFVVLEGIVDLAGLVFGTRCFHCDTCDRCSVTDGIPRRALALWRPLSSVRSYGWVAVGRNEHYCRAHVPAVTER